MRFLFIFFLSLNIYASGPKVQIFNRPGLEIIWIEENRFPTFYLAAYFADGALADKPGKYGSTHFMFNSLLSGTSLYTSAELNEFFESFGTTLDTIVTHEYSLATLGGLTKDSQKLLRMMCHVFRQSNFPLKKIDQRKRQIVQNLNNLAANPSELTSTLHRRLSLMGTDYEYPALGTMKSVQKITANDLSEQLDHFNGKVKKRIFILGPKSVLEAASDILKEDCRWFNDAHRFERTLDQGQQKVMKGLTYATPKIYFVPLKDSNQAQIRLGKFLKEEESAKPEAMQVISAIIGEGFTSRLIQELRVKRGLTYNVMTQAQTQKQYGRSVIATFTKNATVGETLELIRHTLETFPETPISDQELKRSTELLSGHYLLEVENPKIFLTTLVQYYHQNRTVEDLYNFPEIIRRYSSKEIFDKFQQILQWKDLTIVVAGNESVLKQLGLFGDVLVLKNYSDYL